MAGLEALCPDGIRPRPSGEKKHELGDGSGPDGLELIIKDENKLELRDAGALCAVLRRPGVQDRVTALVLRLLHSRNGRGNGRWK